MPYPVRRGREPISGWEGVTVLPGHALCPAVSLSVTGAFREAGSDKLSHSLILTQHHLFPWPRILKIASPSFPLGPVTCEMPQAWGTHVHAYTEHTHSLHTHNHTHNSAFLSSTHRWPEYGLHLTGEQGLFAESLGGGLPEPSEASVVPGGAQRHVGHHKCSLHFL